MLGRLRLLVPNLRALAVCAGLFVAVALAQLLGAKVLAATGCWLGLWATTLWFLWSVAESLGLRQIWRDTRRGDLLATALIVVLWGVWLWSRVSAERFVYYYDFGGYWMAALRQGAEMMENPLRTVAKAIYTVNVSDYNLVPPLFISLPLRWLGGGFPAYVMLIYAAYGIPFLLLIHAAVSDIAQRSGWVPLRLPLIALVLLVQHVLLLPVLYGYIDLVALPGIALAYWLAVRFDFSGVDRVQVVGMALLLVITVVLRRYFAYWVLGFAAAFALRWLGYCLPRLLARDWAALRPALFAVTAVGGLALLILALCFPLFLLHSISYNQAEAYAAWGRGSMLERAGGAAVYLGPALLVALALALAAAASRRFGRQLVTMAVISNAVTLVLFIRIQSFTWHHYYVFFPAIAIALLLGMSSLRRPGDHARLRRGLLAVILLALALNTAVVWSPLHPAMLAPAVTRARYEPRVRHDLPTLHRLVADLKELPELAEGCYVVANSAVLNDDILSRLDLPREADAVPHLTGTAVADLRDGFPVAFLTAGVLVVGDPVQYMMSPSDQKVVGYLAEAVLEGGALSRCFEQVRSYGLDDGVTARVLRRTKPFDADDLDYLRQRFTAAYPHHPRLFEDRFDPSHHR